MEIGIHPYNQSNRVAHGRLSYLTQDRCVI